MNLLFNCLFSIIFATNTYLLFFQLPTVDRIPGGVEGTHFFRAAMVNNNIQMGIEDQIITAHEPASDEYANNPKNLWMTEPLFVGDPFLNDNANDFDDKIMYSTHYFHAREFSFNQATLSARTEIDGIQ